MSLIRYITAACLLMPGTLIVSAQQSSNLLLKKYYGSPVYRDALSNGREYNRYPFYISKGIPYFKADSLSYGTVLYDGILYDTIKLLYDQVADELITSDISGTSLIRLVKPKVAYFTLFNNTFIHLSVTDKNIAPGYYQVIYNGRAQLLKKETKAIIDELKPDEQLKKNIQTRTRIFLKHNGQYYPVNSINSAVSILDKKNSELNSFVKKNKKIYKKADLSEALKEVLTYYEQLTK